MKKMKRVSFYIDEKLWQAFREIVADTEDGEESASKVLRRFIRDEVRRVRGMTPLSIGPIDPALKNKNKGGHNDEKGDD